MSIFDKAKEALTGAKDKAADLIEKNSDKIEHAVDKAGDFVDAKTKGKYSEKIDSAQASAKSAVEKVADKSDGDEAGAATTAAHPVSATPTAPAADSVSATPTAPAADPVSAPTEHVAIAVDAPATTSDDDQSPTS